MPHRRQHQPEVRAFLQNHFPADHWEFSQPHGWGNESYIACSRDRACFVKLGVNVPIYQAAASLGLNPPILAHGKLDDGAPLIVQPYLAGRQPSWQDFRDLLEPVASTLQRLHHSPAIRSLLPASPSETYSQAALRMLDQIRPRWEACRPLVPESASFVDDSLARLTEQAQILPGAGLVAAHHDPCNANWLITDDGRLFLLDFDSLALDDPAADLAPLLWWYYPPELRPRFLALAGYPLSETLQTRLRVRMALHCLHILLPRPGSFDEFDPAGFPADLGDFRAALAGQENPHGYLD